MLSFLSKCLTCGDMAQVSPDNSTLEIIQLRYELNHLEATCHCGRKMILFIDPDSACELAGNGWTVNLWRDCDDSLTEFRDKVRQAHAAGQEGYNPSSDQPDLGAWERLMGYSPSDDDAGEHDDD